MSSQEFPSTYAIAGGVALLFLAHRWYTSRDPALDAIPTVGWSTPLLSYMSAIKFIFNGKAMLQEGYNKYKGGIFKVPMVDHWSVIVTSSALVDELRKAPDEHLDMKVAVVRSIEAYFTLGPSVVDNDYHAGVIRGPLTRNLTPLYPIIRDEIATAFSDIIPPSDDWVKVDTIDAMLQIVCRTSNRLFLGLPICRDPDWIEMNVKFTIDVITSSLIINRFPDFLKPIAGRVFSKLPAYMRRAERHIGPMVEERLKMMAELGDQWTDKPNDLLMWLLEAQGEELTAHNLAARLLTVNFAAMHTSSMSFTQALYRLAANPEWVEIIREEVESVLATDGWTKVGVSKMRKIDSFLRESQRFDGLGLLVMSRYVHRPFTFSNGMMVPAGVVLECPVSNIHHDDEHFPNADVFDPWRFSDLTAPEEDGKHQMVSTNLDFLPFGHGRHACPGRFFAANELKSMMAHIVLEYDIKFEDGKPLPKSMIVGSTVVPAKANIMFRKRQRS